MLQSRLEKAGKGWKRLYGMRRLTDAYRREGSDPPVVPG
jgi:hypothetical protein